MQANFTNKRHNPHMDAIRKTIAEAQSKHDRSVKLTFSCNEEKPPATLEDLQRVGMMPQQRNALEEIQVSITQIAGIVAQINVTLRAYRLDVEPFRLVDLSLFSDRLEERLWLAKSATRKLLVDPDAHKKKELS